MSKGNPRDEKLCFGRAKRAGVLGAILVALVLTFGPSSLSKPSEQVEQSTSQTLAQQEAKIASRQLRNNAGETCLTPELDGEWVLDTNKTFADPFCCEGDDKRWLRNPPQCGNSRPDTDFSGKPDKLAFMRGRGCRCQFTDTYTWKSKALPAVFDPHDFCRLLGNRTILLVGDSSMSQSTTTLMNAAFPAGCQTQMTFAMSDTLILEEVGAWNRGSYWTDAIQKHEPDIVILSSGPHVFGSGNYTRIHEGILADIKILRQATNITFVWKTQQAAGCTEKMYQDTHPFVAAREILKEPMGYNHAEFFERDLFSIRFMQENGIPFLDLRMLYGRSDAHMMSTKDCLHFCAPGALDIFPSVVHRLLETDFAVPQCISRDEARS